MASHVAEKSLGTIRSVLILRRRPDASFCVSCRAVKVTKNKGRFVDGIFDRRVGGLGLQKPHGNRAPVYPAALSKNPPEPFKSEPIGGDGTRMHHKFVVIDFDKSSARVCLGSYNFSKAAGTENGENLGKKFRHLMMQHRPS